MATDSLCITVQISGDAPAIVSFEHIAQLISDNNHIYVFGCSERGPSLQYFFREECEKYSLTNIAYLGLDSAKIEGRKITAAAEEIEKLLNYWATPPCDYLFRGGWDREALESEMQALLKSEPTLEIPYSSDSGMFYVVSYLKAQQKLMQIVKKTGAYVVHVWS